MQLTESNEYKECKEKYEHKAMRSIAEKVVKEEIQATTESEIVKHQMKRLEISAELAKKKDDINKKICEVDLRDVLQARSTLFFFFSVCASIVSIFMSCAGISNCYSPTELLHAVFGKYWISVLLMALLQTSVILYAFYSYALKLYHSDKNKLINAYRFVVMTVSIYCNYLFIKMLVPEYSKTCIGKSIAIFLASGPDIISNLFSSTAIKMKYKLYHNKSIMANQEGVSLFEKVRFIIFGKIIMAIDKWYKETMVIMSVENGKSRNRKNEKMATVKKIATHNERSYQKQDKEMENLDEEDEEFRHRKPDCFEFAMNKMVAIGVKPGNRIKRSMVGLSVPEWKSLRRYMQLNGAFKCVLKSTFLEKDLKEVEKELA